MNQPFGIIATPALRKSAFAAVLLSGWLLAGCATPQKPPQISYDASVPPLPAAPVAALDERPKPLHVPPGWVPARGGAAGSTPVARVENANAAARVQPRREGYYNAIQIYPWSEGALYQVYAAPGQITDIALEPGESLTGEGPIAAGDTARWIIGDTESGAGVSRRVHVLVKPSRPDINTNLVITTDRRSYMIELQSGEEPYMPAVSWAYPAAPAGQARAIPATPVIPAITARNYRYGFTGDAAPWRPVSVYDDGRRAYVEFPRGIVQGEMPPIFVIGPDGEAEIANSRVYQNTLIVDRLFGAAELRLGSGKRQQTVRIVRTDATRRGLWMSGTNAAPSAKNAFRQRGGEQS
ncbi:MULTISPECIES: P-type conjugative transfer protein TrbG [unclassified Mesorhizobium]|uniref:P-type conjugative transfer protein TrbG n=2 Tax=Mesorhizobium TaxID=68287 RepID=UPI0011296E62|nr:MULTISPECIES: P-type conjugative transfer protein TrbG [unclassified Mesorhizobium]MCA0024611.1 P-type conjugative transfer protein TrbG [Mesorhizobium sp. B263B1A]MCA0055717.1 P-type conjugative transfer protein TrbG [Mesorhizobium sp. B261B1A]TPI46084.1 P-type conjugative transfer protein TrbG [Mesorhizobium sp. B3-1-1]TPJ59085.1 P-type conjugative transfer protein TrbG [Mesorhizobium sp. B2-6-1]TPJ60048.1 P-type conjugative transfer protein TrbG [Mesorhizobium sp. B2-6-7]